MKAEFISREINTVSMRMEVTAEELNKQLDAVYKENKKHFTVPGFRKGKAPRKIIENLYGKGIFMEDAVTAVFNEFYGPALDELGYEPVDNPDIEVDGGNIEEGNGVVFNVKFLCTPEVFIESYDGIEVGVPMIEVSEFDVNRALESTAKRNARLIPVEREARMNDTVIIDYKGFLEDGEQFEGGTAEGFDLKIGSNTFVGGFEDQIIGMEIGEEKVIEIRFPSTYREERLAGEIAKFETKLHEVMEEEVPPIDDDLARECSEFDTLEEWKEDMRANLKKSREGHRRDQIKNEVMKKLSEEAIIDIPEVMIDHEVDRLMTNFDQQLSYSGMTLDSYLESAQESEDDFRATVREDAERKLRANLIIQEIARRENVTVTPEELDEEIRKMGIQYGLDVEQTKEMIGSDMKYVERDLRSKKALEIVADRADVEDLPIMPEGGLDIPEEEQNPFAEKIAAEFGGEAPEEEAEEVPAEE